MPEMKVSVRFLMYPVSGSVPCDADSSAVPIVPKEILRRRPQTGQTTYSSLARVNSEPGKPCAVLPLRRSQEKLSNCGAPAGAVQMLAPRCSMRRRTDPTDEETTWAVGPGRRRVLTPPGGNPHSRACRLGRSK